MKVSKLENKYSDLLSYIRSIIDGKTTINEEHIRRKISETFDVKVKDSKTKLLSIAKNNKDKSLSFSHLDFRRPEAFETVEAEVKAFFRNRYSLKLVNLFKQLKSTSSRNETVQEIIDIFEQKTPVIVLNELIADEQEALKQPPIEQFDDKPTESTDSFEKPTVNIRAMLGGLGATAYAASKQKSLLKGSYIAALGTASVLKTSVGRGFGSSISSNIGKIFGKKRNTSSSSIASSFSDFTPREESLEAAKKQDEIVNLLEKIEENTRENRTTVESTESGKGIAFAIGTLAKDLIKSFGSLVTTIGKWFPALIAALGLGTIAKGFGIPNLLRRGPKGKTPIPTTKGKTAALLKNPAKSTTIRAAGRIAGRGALLALGPVGAIAGTAMLAYDAASMYNDYSKNKFKENLGDISQTGGLTRSLESGGNYGAVNPNDNGKASYGAYQFRDGSGLDSLMDTINSEDQFAPLAEGLSGLKPGSKDFNEKWKSLATSPETSSLMKQAQDQTWQNEYYIPAVKMAADAGFNTSSDKLKETIASAYTVSPTATSSTLRSIAGKYGKGLSKMSAEEQSNLIIEHLQKNSKIDSNRLAKTSSFINSNTTSISPLPKKTDLSVATAINTVAGENKNIVYAPTNNNNVQNISNDKIADTRNTMNPYREYSFSRLVMP